MKPSIKYFFLLFSALISFSLGVAFQSNREKSPMLDDLDGRNLKNTNAQNNKNSLIKFEVGSDSLVFVDLDQVNRRVFVRFSRSFGDPEEGRTETITKITFTEDDGVSSSYANFAKRGSRFYRDLNFGMEDFIESSITPNSDLGNTLEYVDLNFDGLPDVRKQLGKTFILREATWEEAKGESIVKSSSRMRHVIIPSPQRN